MIAYHEITSDTYATYTPICDRKMHTVVKLRAYVNYRYHHNHSACCIKKMHTVTQIDAAFSNRVDVIIQITEAIIRATWRTSESAYVLPNVTTLTSPLDAVSSALSTIPVEFSR